MRQSGRQAEAGQRSRVVGFGQVLVRNRLAALARDVGGELRERVGLVASEFVGLAVVPRRRKHRNRRVGVVGARGRRDLALARAAHECTAGQRTRDRTGVVLGVPAVAQDRERDARRPQHAFGLVVFRCQAQQRRVGAQQARIDDALDAGLLRRRDDVAMLRSALADLARRDQQQRLDAGQRAGERFRLRVVGLARSDAEARRLGRRAHERTELLGRKLGFEPGNDESAELSGGAGDGDSCGHGGEPLAVNEAPLYDQSLLFVSTHMKVSTKEAKPAPLSRRLRRGDLLAEACPSREVLKHVTSRWGVLVLMVLETRIHRFAELRRAIGGVSERMLAQTLQWLEGDGLVLRIAHDVVPPRVEYRLTPLGRQAAKRVRGLADWIEVNLPKVLQARANILGSKQK